MADRAARANAGRTGGKAGKSKTRAEVVLIGLTDSAAHAAEVPLAAPAGGAEVMLKSLEDRLGGNPFDPVAMNNLAVVRLAENDPYAAAELLGRAFQLAPDNAVIADNNRRLASWIEARARAEQRASAGKPVAAKYRDAASGQTWSGRGLKPKWLTAAIEDAERVQEAGS